MVALDDIEPSTGTTPADNGEEMDLWRAYRATGAVAARQKLFELHFDFARRLAAKHYLDRKSGDLEFGDLSQLACTGLIEAIERYDPDRGVPFQPYARRRISGSILDGLSHMSERREQLAFRQRARKDRIKSLTLDDPGKLDAADAMTALAELATGLALGFMIEGSGMFMTQDQSDQAASPYDSLAWKETTQNLKAEIAQLPDPGGQVIRFHYLDGLSFEHIARAFSLSKGRISQIHRTALKVLRERLSPATAFNLKK